MENIFKIGDKVIWKDILNGEELNATIISIEEYSLTLENENGNQWEAFPEEILSIPHLKN